MGEGRGHQGMSSQIAGVAYMFVSPTSCACSPQLMNNLLVSRTHTAGTLGCALQVLMAWSDERVVISFRGTASWQNVMADLQFWLTGAQLFIAHCVTSSDSPQSFCIVIHPATLYARNTAARSCHGRLLLQGVLLMSCPCAGHPPIRGRGNWLCGTRPHVHAGFLRSWQANGLNQKLLKRIKGIVGAATPKGKLPRQTVYVTGNPPAKWSHKEPTLMPVCGFTPHIEHFRSLCSPPGQVIAWAVAWRCWRPTTSPRGCRR